MATSNNRCRNSIVIVIFTVFICGMILLAFPEHLYLHFTQTASQLDEGTRDKSFQIVTLDGVFTFFNVCLEPLPNPVSVNVHQITFRVTQRIVIYDQSQRRSGNQRLNIAGPPGHPWNYYDIHFKNSILPRENRTFMDNVAYFVSTRCPGNLHHFFHEEYIPLYSMVRLSQRLYPGAGNLIIYPTPKTNHNPFCRNFNTYNEIMRTLYTNDFHDVFYNLPPNTCFKRAVFGSRIFLNDTREFVDHIIRLYNLSDVCPKKADYVTVISRKHRRIANIEDLHNWLLETGFDKDFVRITDFGHIPIRQQIFMACSSQVMIGINGAALQWSTFMPENSHVVEMSWPSRSWGFFYANLLPTYRLIYHSVELKDVRPNWTTYEFRIRNGGKIGDAERERMLKSPPQDLWKWSDGFLHKEELNTTLENIFNSLNGPNFTTAACRSISTGHRSK